MVRKQITFIQNSLFPAGGERHFLEIIKYLVKFQSDKFIIEFVLFSPSFDKSDYYSELKELSVNVTFLNNFPQNSLFKRKIDAISRRLLGKSIFQERFIKKLDNCKRQVDQRTDLYVFNKIQILKKYMSNFSTNKEIAFHAISHSNQVQTNIYKDVLENSIHVSYPCEQMKYEMENEKSFNIIDNHRINMPFFQRFNKPKITSSNEKFVIGYLARLSWEKAFMMAISLLHQLRCKGIDVEMLFIGSQKDQKYFKELQRNLSLMHVKEYARFINHVDDLSELRKYNIDLIVAGGVNDFVGYSSLESIATGIPVVVWDQSIKGCKTDDFLNIFPRSSSIDTFAQIVVDLLLNNDARKGLIERQQSHIKGHNDWIEIGEELAAFYSKAIEG